MSAPPRSPLPELETALQLIEEAALTGDLTLLDRAGGVLVRLIGTASPENPVSPGGVPHLHWPPRGFIWSETASAYASWNDRWIVSLISGFGPHEVGSAEEACAAARHLVTGPHSAGTRWFVHDRRDDTDVIVPQGRLPAWHPGAPTDPPSAA